MVSNPTVLEAVLMAISIHQNSHDDAFKLICNENNELGAMLLKDMGKLRVDLLHKVRFDTAHLIGYGYDFTKADDKGVPAKQVYDRAIESTKKFSGNPNFEQLIAQGITEDTFGWYLTQV
jgi:hypothetical protein